MTDIAWGDLISLQAPDWHSLPDTNTPYYVTAKEGTFLHRRTALGRGLVRHYKPIAKLQPVGNTAGHFTFDAQEIPARIYAQAVSFFKRIWDNHKTEAEVLITQNHETKEYRLFVPTQRVSHGGVFSIYNPIHISPNYLVVGTFHSHCNFSPYHSSTDEGDARDMDGIHGTIGFLDKEIPEMALMVALNGTLYHFTPPFNTVVDTTDLTAATAPDWWDRYVLFDTIQDADRAKIAPYATDTDWEKFMGRYRKPVIQNYQPQAPRQINKNYQPKYTGSLRDNPENWDNWHRDMTAETMRENGYVWDGTLRTFRWMGSALSRESTEFNMRRNPQWSADGALLPDDTNNQNDSDDWKAFLGDQFINELFATGLFSEDDFEEAMEMLPESAEPEYWERQVKMKMRYAMNWLTAQGITVQLSIKDNRVKQVPGQMTIEQIQEGVTA